MNINMKYESLVKRLWLALLLYSLQMHTIAFFFYYFTVLTFFSFIMLCYAMFYVTLFLEFSYISLSIFLQIQILQDVSEGPKHTTEAPACGSPTLHCLCD